MTGSSGSNVDLRRSNVDPRRSSVDPRIKGWVETEVTFLEMRARPARPPAAAHSGIEVRRAREPTVSFYRYLYDTIGRDWNWSARRLLDDETLAAHIQNPKIEINVLWVEGVPAGLIELDLRTADDIALLYFGLIPDFIGKGLGRLALGWAIDRAWSYDPARFWLHTCDLDHPHALSVYQKAGLVIFDRKKVPEAVLHEMPPPRRKGIAVPTSEITQQPAGDPHP